MSKKRRTPRQKAIQRLYRNTTAKDRKEWNRQGISFEEMLEWANYEYIPGQEDREFSNRRIHEPFIEDSVADIAARVQQAKKMADAGKEADVLLASIEDRLKAIFER